MKLCGSMHVALPLGCFCETRNIQNPMPEQPDISQTLTTPLPRKQVLYTEEERDIYFLP